MFDLAPHPTNPIRRGKSNRNIRLSKDRGLPPDLPEKPESYLVELTGDDDPANAKSWTNARKLRTALVLGFDTLVASWGSSVYSAATTPIAAEFGVSEEVALLGLTLYILGFAL